jgi:hypothetical protein
MALNIIKANGSGEVREVILLSQDIAVVVLCPIVCGIPHWVA